MGSLIRRMPGSDSLAPVQMCLSFKCFPYALHTANNIKKHIQLDVLNKWTLHKPDLVTVSPDGASNMVKAVLLLGLSVDPCDAHGVQRYMNISQGWHSALGSS